ncbi:response regulator [Flavobacterium rhizosphaerae]|uniref:Response regulator transcription factor n=1 Tax=Flavobacterium rhizosphaerae TaxID=3163298 RepID=A0ABW8YT55_9FLAO
METVTIGIADDHKIVRHGLKELLHKLGNYKVTHEFESGTQLLAALPINNSPQLFIVDYSMPGLNGVEVLKTLEEKGLDCKVLLLTQHFNEEIIDAAYHYGARGFLHKNCTAQDLKFAIDNIVSIGFNNVVEILKRVRNYNTADSNEEKPPLSHREHDFLRLVCDEREYTYDQIADIMSVSVKSVEAYRTALFEKYNIRSKVGLVLFSHKHKLTEPFL